MYMGIQEMKDADIKRGSATGDGSTVFAIGWTPPSEQSLWVNINGVTQQDSAYTISGSNITLQLLLLLEMLLSFVAYSQAVR